MVRKCAKLYDPDFSVCRARIAKPNLDYIQRDSKIGNLRKRRPEFELGVSVTEAAQLK